MALRAGHGNGRGSPRIEVLPADEQPQALHPAPIERDGKGKVRSSEDARRLAKLPRRARAGVPKSIATHPRFEVHNKRRVKWTAARRGELQASHGGVSHAVGALIVHAGWLHAAGECASELAAESLDFDLFKTAANLTAAARQHELAAWELCARESLARRDANPGAPHAALKAAFGGDE